MKAYQSKVVTIHAVQFDGDASVHEAIGEQEAPIFGSEAERGVTHFFVEGQHGREGIWPTDWLIQGMENEFYPCKDSVFTRKYESKV